MSNIVSIVEGDGEVIALPIILRRLPKFCDDAEEYVEIARPIRVYKDRFLNKQEEFNRHLLLAAAKCESNGWILILLDADDACPKDEAETILNRARLVVPHRKISVVLANREFEAWFIAAAGSLEGCRGFAVGDGSPPEPETKRDAKGWIKERMPNRSYGEVTDQPALAQAMDLAEVHRRSRSFRKLCSEWCKQRR